MAKSIFYVGRIVKTGTNYDQKKLIEAILKAPPIKAKKYNWGFVETGEGKVEGCRYIYGQLAQYDRDGEIDVIEESTRSKRKSKTRNQVRSASKFVYVPEHSGIVFQNIWNSIPVKSFVSMFSELVDSFYEKMFVKTEIELVTDYQKFSSKIKNLDSVVEISANVHLPNPLFGDLWKELDHELRNRSSERLSIAEKAKYGTSIKTNIIQLIKSVLDSRAGEKMKVSMSDAAILMAADGYGKGTVLGIKDNKYVEVKTDKMEMTISLDTNSDMTEIAKKAVEVFNEIQRERKMKHGR